MSTRECHVKCHVNKACVVKLGYRLDTREKIKKICVNIQKVRAEERQITPKWYGRWDTNGSGSIPRLRNYEGGGLKPHVPSNKWIVTNHNKPGDMPANQIENPDDDQKYECFVFDSYSASEAWKANPVFGEERMNLSQFQ